MKKLKFVSVVILCCMNSFILADVISDLQITMLKFQNQGLSYKYTSNLNYVITEKGTTKHYEDKKKSMTYLYINNRLYNTVSIHSNDDPEYNPTQMIIPTEQQINEIAEIQIPTDYQDFKVVKREIVNGYNCQILEKIESNEQIFQPVFKNDDIKELKDKKNAIKKRDKQGKIRGFVVSIVKLVRLSISEEYGYPTRIEYLENENPYKPTINITNFSTIIDENLVSMPRYPFFMKHSYDFDNIKYQQLLQQIRNDKQDDIYLRY